MRDGPRALAWRRASSEGLLILALCGVSVSAHAQPTEETVSLAGLVTEAEGRNPEVQIGRAHV